MWVSLPHIDSLEGKFLPFRELEMHEKENHSVSSGQVELDQTLKQEIHRKPLLAHCSFDSTQEKTASAE